MRSRSDLHFGLYHSLYEWFHPLYKDDKANKFHTRKFVQVICISAYYDNECVCKRALLSLLLLVFHNILTAKYSSFLCQMLLCKTSVQAASILI